MTVDEHLGQIDRRLDTMAGVLTELVGSQARGQEMLRGLVESINRYVEAADGRI